MAFRVLQGAFGGGLIATSQLVMRETFPPESIGISSALFAMALILGPAFGPLAGGYLTDNFSWQWIFDVNILPGALAFFVIVALLRNPVPPARTKIDWTGIGLLALGLGSLQVPLDNGERNDWFADPHMQLAGGLAVLALGTFAWWQWSGTKNPAVDLHVLRFRSVWMGSLLALAFGALIFAPAIITPLYSSFVLGYPAFDSGLLLMTRALPVVALTPVFATLAGRGAPVRYILGAGFILSAVSLYWLATRMTPSTEFSTLGIALFASGIGQSRSRSAYRWHPQHYTAAAQRENNAHHHVVRTTGRLDRQRRQYRDLRSANELSLRCHRQRDDRTTPLVFHFFSNPGRAATAFRSRRTTGRHVGFCRYDLLSWRALPAHEGYDVNDAVMNFARDLRDAGASESDIRELACLREAVTSIVRLIDDDLGTALFGGRIAGRHGAPGPEPLHSQQGAHHYG